MTDLELTRVGSANSLGAGQRFARRYREDRLLRVAVRVLGSIVALALFAPLVASGRPFVLWIAASEHNRGFGALPEGLTFPWFAALFDARYYESVVDRIWNGAMLVVPALWLFFRFVRHARARVFAWLIAIGLVGFGAFVEHSEKSRDYRFGVERLRAQGVAVKVVFPPVRFGATEIDSSVGAAGSSWQHPFGTDPIGRDVLARLAFGGRSALSIGLLATALAYAIGIALGALAGYRGGVLDLALMRLVDVVACVPFFVLLLALIAVIRERSLVQLAVVLALTTWDDVARLVRGEYLRLRELEFAKAARALGLPSLRIALRHLLPFALVPLLATCGFSIARGVTVESTLAFLGLSDPIVPSWGETMNAGRITMQAHLILVPGILIFCLVSAIHLVADAVRDALDTRSERR